MRISLSRKIFWLFLPMTTISLLFGVTVYYGLSGINLANSQISHLKDFQLQLKELEIWQTNMASPHGDGYCEDCKGKINKTKEMAADLVRIHANLPQYLRSRLEKISFFMDNFSRASLELYNRYDTDLRFSKKNGALLNTLDARVDDLAVTVDPQLLNSFRNQLHKLPTLQLKIYHDRDTSNLPELKEIKREMARIMNRPDMLTIVDQFIANLEANYLNYLGIKDREDFLDRTSERFFQVSMDTIQAIEKRNKRTKRIFILAVIGITLLAILLNLLCWLYSSRYFRLFLANHQYAIQAIEKNDYDFDLPRLPDDEIGDLTRTLKQMFSYRQQAEKELEKHREHLEELVEKRTEELKEKTGKIEESRKALTYLVEDANKARQNLEKANIKLKELDRLKSMFIASMSHELRTPLNSIIGFTGIILQGLTGEINAEQKDQLQRVYGSAKHLLNLITDIIDISKIEAGKVEVYAKKVNLNGLIKEAVSTLKPEIDNKGLGLEISLPQDLQLTTDRKRLLQCILNYLSNAVKFTEKGKIEIAAQEVDGMMEIRVKDTGVGIKQEDIPKLFKSFVRLDTPLKTVIPGTGLGLYLTKKLATEVLGGEVSVESTYGEGSMFGIRIPKEI